MFDAFTPKSDPEKLFADDGITTQWFDDANSSRLNSMSAFFSHYTLWKECVKHNEEFMIFEHDAVVTNNMPRYLNYDKCINLGKPSYGRYNTPLFIGVGPLTSKEYFPGAHAYRVKPAGAKLMIEGAKTLAQTTDLYLNIKTFPWLQEFSPWIAEARDTFSTLQHKAYCVTKHNYNEDYKMIHHHA